MKISCVVSPFPKAKSKAFLKQHSERVFALLLTFLPKTLFPFLLCREDLRAKGKLARSVRVEICFQRC